MSDQSQQNPILRLKSTSGGQILYFFGAKHTNDLTDTQFSYLKQLWEEFFAAAKGGKIVFVEGTTHGMPQSYEEAIRQYGEAGAIQWLAMKEDVETIRPELDDLEQRKTLCTIFHPQFVAYTVIVQNLAGWFRHTGQSSFDEAIGRVLSREAKFRDVYGFVPDKSWLEGHHKRLFGEQRLEDKGFLDSISDPRKTDTIVNSIVASRSKMRDEYILSAITKVWKSGKSIFIVYGKGHLNALENSLQELTRL
ncbi:MAG: hypothetical protein Q8P21_02015 [bacterium]|nr:hypothetical protein [bacterium]